MACPTSCDTDCPEPCHEVHVPYWKRTHDPETCHVERGWWQIGRMSNHGPGDDMADLLLTAFDREYAVWLRQIHEDRLHRSL